MTDRAPDSAPRRAAGDWRPAALVGVLVTAAVLASWRWRFLEHGVHPPVDLYLYFYPQYEAFYGRLARGELALWNPWQLCGIPWVATLQGGFFYPGHLLFLLLPVNRALEISQGLHLVVVALAMAAFVRRLGLSWTAAVLGTVLYTLRGFVPLNLAPNNYVDTATWIPVGAIAVLALARGAGAGAVAMLAASTGLSFLGGYPQPTIYAFYTWGTLLLVLLLQDGAPLRRWLTSGALFAGGVTLGALAAAAQLAPTYELVQSGRHLALPVEVLSPFGTLSPAMLILGGALAGGPFTYGVTALALAATALLTPRRRAIALWAVGMSVLTALLALGPNGPIFWLYQRLPFLGMFRFPDRIIAVTDFTVAVAAAIGLDAVAGARRPGGTRPVVPIVALVALGALVALAARGWAPPDRMTQVYAVGLAAAAVLAMRAGVARVAPAIVAAALVLVATTDISLSPWLHRMTYGTTDMDAWAKYEPMYRAVAERAGSGRVWFYGDMTILPEFAQKLATRFGLRAIDDYEPLNPGRHDEYFTYFTEGTPMAQRFPWLFAGSITTLKPPPGAAPPAARRRLLDLAGLRVVVMPQAYLASHPEADAFVRDAGLVPLGIEQPPFALFANPHAVPRAFVTYAARPAPPTAELLAAIARDDFDPLAGSWVDGETGLPPDAHGAPGHPARIVEDGERVVEIEATLERPGLVVLGDAFYPGWYATLDGTPVDILPTNHLFRGVVAPAGTHRIRFEYRPWSVRLGIAASAVGWTAIAVLAWRSRRRRLATPGET